jgi:mannose-6-phosphate isomerase-like protein (cupin superfamily)
MSFHSEIRLRSEQTGGRVGIVEVTVPAGWPGPPLHHHDFDEAFYVRDGALTFQVGDGRRLAGPGTLAFAPRGSHHTLANLGDVPARYLLVCTPGGFERRFDPDDDRSYPETIVVGPQIDGPGAGVPAPPAGPIRVLLRGEETGGVVSVVDNDVGAGSPGPFLHTHDVDEAFCVLEGALTFQVGDELVAVGAGDVAFAPRGVPHMFSNRDGGPGRELIICTEAGFERHFARIAAKQAGEEPPAWAQQPSPPVTRVGPRIGEAG